METLDLRLKLCAMPITHRAIAKQMDITPSRLSHILAQDSVREDTAARILRAADLALCETSGEDGTV